VFASRTKVPWLVVKTLAPAGSTVEEEADATLTLLLLMTLLRSCSGTKSAGISFTIEFIMSVRSSTGISLAGQRSQGSG
jgi:hypothetical protein